MAYSPNTLQVPDFISKKVKESKEIGTIEKNDIAGKNLIEEKKKLGERRRRG